MGLHPQVFDRSGRGQFEEKQEQDRARRSDPYLGELHPERENDQQERAVGEHAPHRFFRAPGLARRREGLEPREGEVEAAAGHDRLQESSGIETAVRPPHARVHLVVEDRDHRREEQTAAEHPVEPVLQEDTDEDHRLRLEKPGPGGPGPIETLVEGDGEEERRRQRVGRLHRAAAHQAQGGRREGIGATEGEERPPAAGRVGLDPEGERQPPRRQGVEQRRAPGVLPVEVVLRLAREVRDQEDDPVDEQGAQAQTHDIGGQDALARRPQEETAVGGDDPAERHDVPVAPQQVYHGAEAQERGRQESEGLDAVQHDGGIPETVGERRQPLVLVAQRVADHADTDQEQEREADERALDDARRLELVHGVGGRVKRRPAAADEPAPVKSVGLAALQEDAAPDHRQGRGRRQRRLARRPQPGERVPEREGDPDHQESDADPVQPRAADPGLPGIDRLAARPRPGGTGRRRSHRRRRDPASLRPRRRNRGRRAVDRRDRVRGGGPDWGRNRGGLRRGRGNDGPRSRTRRADGGPHGCRRRGRRLGRGMGRLTTGPEGREPLQPGEVIAQRVDPLVQAADLLIEPLAARQGEQRQDEDQNEAQELHHGRRRMELPLNSYTRRQSRNAVRIRRRTWRGAYHPFRQETP